MSHQAIPDEQVPAEPEIDSQDRFDMVVRFQNLRPEHVLGLRAMFNRWEVNGKIGASRNISYFVDGDGTFHPEIDVSTNCPGELTDLRRDAVEVSNNKFVGNRLHSEFRDDMESLHEQDPAELDIEIPDNDE